MKKLKELKEKIQKNDGFYNVFVEDNKIIVEESYYNDDEKNDDDCCDLARENGEMIVKKYPELMIHDYYCHRHKYSIVTLKLSDNES